MLSNRTVQMYATTSACSSQWSKNSSLFGEFFVLYWTHDLPRFCVYLCMRKENTMMIYGILKDGNKFEVSPITGKEVIERLWTNDHAMPPETLVIDTQTKDGTRVRIYVPFDDVSKSLAEIG